MDRFHNPKPHRHHPWETYYGSTPRHLYRRVKLLGFIPVVRCSCGLPRCDEAEREAERARRQR